MITFGEELSASIKVEEKVAEPKAQMDKVL
jgi:hypothetical protein